MHYSLHQRVNFTSRFTCSKWCRAQLFSFG